MIGRSRKKSFILVLTKYCRLVISGTPAATYPGRLFRFSSIILPESDHHQYLPVVNTWTTSCRRNPDGSSHRRRSGPARCQCACRHGGSLPMDRPGDGMSSGPGSCQTPLGMQTQDILLIGDTRRLLPGPAISCRKSRTPACCDSARSPGTRVDVDLARLDVPDPAKGIFHLALLRQLTMHS